MNVQTIERFILDDLLQSSGKKSIDLDESLVSSGVIDSLGMLRLIGFLEQEVGLTIGDGEVAPENFETLRKIQEFIERKRTA
jgi:acyl carrier protein